MSNDLEILEKEIKELLVRFDKLRFYCQLFGRTLPNGKQTFLSFKCVDNIESILKGTDNLDILKKEYDNIKG